MSELGKPSLKNKTKVKKKTKSKFKMPYLITKPLARKINLVETKNKP